LGEGERGGVREDTEEEGLIFWFAGRVFSLTLACFILLPAFGCFFSHSWILWAGLFSFVLSVLSRGGNRWLGKRSGNLILCFLPFHSLLGLFFCFCCRLACHRAGLGGWAGNMIMTG
jgi:hypothetical protein